MKSPALFSSFSSSVRPLVFGALSLALASAAISASTGCELAVNLDLGLVDAGETPCTVCLDDADTVIYDDAGDPEIVPKEAGPSADDAGVASVDASDASDASH